MLVKKINKTQVEVKMYGNIGGWFVDGFNFSSIIDDLESSGVTEATFRMHCYGGSVFEGDVIGGAFARSKMKINIIIDGIAASMACMILPYVKPENITIAENGFGMIHRPSGSKGGDAADHLSTAKLLLDMEGNFIRTLSERTGIAATEIKAKYFDGKDHWLNADEMVQLKLAGKKVKSVATIAQLDKLQVEKMTEENIYARFAAKLDIPNLKNNFQMKEDLIKAFKLEGVTAESSDTAVIAAILAMVKTKDDRITLLEASVKTERETSAKAALDAAEAAGKLTKETRPTYQQIAENSGLEVLNTVLAGLPGKQPATPGGKVIIKDLIQSGGGKTPEAGAKTWADYQKEDPRALERMAVENPEAFNALYEAEYGVKP